MDIKSTLGISPEYLGVLQKAASRYLGSGAPSAALQRGIQNLFETYSPDVLRKRAEIRSRWGFAPEGFNVSVTNACNLHCRYCYYGAESLAEDVIVHIDLDRLGIVFGEMKDQFGIRFVILTGGETTFRLREIAERYPDITFFAYTNGKLLTADFCRDLENFGNVIIALTIVGQQATHDTIRPGNYVEVMDAVENLRHSRLVWGFSLTESRVNYNEIVEADLLDFFLQFEPFFFRMIPFMPVGREQKDWALTLEEYAQIAAIIQDKRQRNGVLIHDYINDPTVGIGCMAGGVKNFLITERFELSPCVFMDTLTPPLEFKDESSNLVEVLREHPYFTRARDLAARFPRCIILQNSNWREKIVH